MDRTHAFTWIDYALLVATVIVSLGMGLYQALKGDKQRTTEEYLMADRKMKIVPVAVSLTISFISGISLLGLPAEIYFYGIHYWFTTLGGMCGIAISAFCHVPVYYPLRMVSINEVNIIIFSVLFCHTETK